MLGTVTANEAGFFLRLVGRMGKFPAITNRPGWIWNITKIVLPMGGNVVVTGASLVVRI